MVPRIGGSTTGGGADGGTGTTGAKKGLLGLGCGCEAGSNTGSTAWLLLAAVGLLAQRRRGGSAA